MMSYSDTKMKFLFQFVDLKAWQDSYYLCICQWYIICGIIDLNPEVAVQFLKWKFLNCINVHIIHIHVNIQHDKVEYLWEGMLIFSLHVKIIPVFSVKMYNVNGVGWVGGVPGKWHFQWQTIYTFIMTQM